MFKGRFVKQSTRYLLLGLMLGVLGGCHDSHHDEPTPPENSDETPPAATPAPVTPTYEIGGTVNGLQGTLSLQNAADTLTVSHNGAFTFATAIAENSAYQVTITQQPDLQTCTVANGSGQATATVSDITISCTDQPVSATVDFSFRELDFSWQEVNDASYYQLLENKDGHSGFTAITDHLTGTSYTLDNISLNLKANARYLIAACSAQNYCVNSSTLTIANAAAQTAIGIQNTGNGADDRMGFSVALSGDGNTLAVGAPYEDGDATSTFAQPNDNQSNAGAVYIFTKDNDGQWQQHQYIKSNTPAAEANFGSGVALSTDGNTLAVGVYGDLNDDDINAIYANESYVDIYTRSGSGWQEQTQLHPPADHNCIVSENIVYKLSLSADGNTVAMGCIYDTIEDGSEFGMTVGSVLVFQRQADTWQHTVLYADTPQQRAYLGTEVALSADGHTLLASAEGLAVANTPANTDGITHWAGGVYVFVQDENSGQWQQQVLIQSDDIADGDYFGESIALTPDAKTLLAMAPGAQEGWGKAYVFSREGTQWQQQSVITNMDEGEQIVEGLSISADGKQLALGNWASFSLYEQTEQGYQLRNILYADVGWGFSFSFAGDGTLAVGMAEGFDNIPGITTGLADTNDGPYGAVYLF